MFIRNSTKKSILERSFEGGYAITVPVGVCAIFDKAGEFLVAKYVPQGENGKWKGGQFIPSPSPTPAIVKATVEQWKADKEKYAKVERFQIPRQIIPKPELIRIAKERGLEVGANMDEDEIVELLNNQPVPEKIEYPTVEYPPVSPS